MLMILTLKSKVMRGNLHVNILELNMPTLPISYMGGYCDVLEIMHLWDFLKLFFCLYDIAIVIFLTGKKCL